MLARIGSNAARCALRPTMVAARSAPAAMQRRGMAEEPKAAGGAIPAKLTLNLLAPHAAIFSKKLVDQVIVPGADGMFGILPGHVPTISELRPGTVEVTIATGEVEKYFVSSGFAFAHADSTLDVCAIECVKFEDLDPALVSSGKKEAEDELSRATDEVEKAKAQIAVEVYTAMTESLAAAK
ncbi:putative ATP synthase delta chain precursor, mitochondrial [Baffinella frigidus]|nr:putative ATP synthase delta chain precursor, mitochondrial [Cryptophyta sp. CCMP2293]